MAIKTDTALTPQGLRPLCENLFECSARKIRAIEQQWDPARGTPVFTVKGQYTSRGWTEWTQGFHYGSALLQFDATDEREFLESGWRGTVESMARHVSHVGVHDHGFNNVSTYGNLWRLQREGRIPEGFCDRNFLELALKVSGAIQAARWTEAADGHGYIYSFNGPHSLFVDTIRSLRSLAMAYQLGHALMGERDRRISLLERLLVHGRTTARFSVFYGAGRDAFDVPGRTAHEVIFNLNDGSYRCPNSQQGYSPFSTWTRGLAWAILGFAEQLEFLDRQSPDQAEFQIPAEAGANKTAGAPAWKQLFARAARVTADFYLANCCTDGIPMWDTGAPNLWRLGDYLSRPSDPFNDWEPVDSSAAAIAAQGLIRLGNRMLKNRRNEPGAKYRQAGLTIARTLFQEPFLSTRAKHQGLVLHSVYHRPNGWDYTAPGQQVPNGESSLWGDYHARELALLILREARQETPLKFFGPDAFS